MFRTLAVVVVIFASARTVVAESAVPEQITNAPTTPAKIPVAIAVNSPVGWLDGSFGISAYWGIGNQHAIRFNVARYQTPSVLRRGLIGVLSNGEASVFTDDFIDASIGYVLFPRRRWSGPLLEAAVMLRRPVDSVTSPTGINEYHTDTRILAGRVLAGWSWLIGERTFISIAMGAARGYEWGAEKTDQALDTRMPETRSISRGTPTTFESFFRIGRTFDL